MHPTCQLIHKDLLRIYNMALNHVKASQSLLSARYCWNKLITGRRFYLRLQKNNNNKTRQQNRQPMWLSSTSASFLFFHRKHAWIIKTTVLLLIVKIISKLPGAVYYITIVIFCPKISISPTSLSAPGHEASAAFTLSKAVATPFAHSERNGPTPAAFEAVIPNISQTSWGEGFFFLPTFYDSTLCNPFEII